MSSSYSDFQVADAVVALDELKARLGQLSCEGDEEELRLRLLKQVAALSAGPDFPVVVAQYQQQYQELEARTNLKTQAALLNDHSVVQWSQQQRANQKENRAEKERKFGALLQPLLQARLKQMPAANLRQDQVFIDEFQAKAKLLLERVKNLTCQDDAQRERQRLLLTSITVLLMELRPSGKELEALNKLETSSKVFETELNEAVERKLKEEADASAKLKTAADAENLGKFYYDELNKEITKLHGLKAEAQQKSCPVLVTSLEGIVGNLNLTFFTLAQNPNMTIEDKNRSLGNLLERTQQANQDFAKQLREALDERYAQLVNNQINS